MRESATRDRGEHGKSSVQLNECRANCIRKEVRRAENEAFPFFHSCAAIAIARPRRLCDAKFQVPSFSRNKTLTSVQRLTTRKLVPIEPAFVENKYCRMLKLAGNRNIDLL